MRMRGGTERSGLTLPVGSGKGLLARALTVLADVGTRSSHVPWRPSLGAHAPPALRGTGEPRTLRACPESSALAADSAFERAGDAIAVEVGLRLMEEEDPRGLALRCSAEVGAEVETEAAEDGGAGGGALVRARELRRTSGTIAGALAK